MSEFHDVAYMNVPPTELARRFETESDPAKRWAMRQGNPLAWSASRVARAWLSSFLRL